MWNGRDRTGWLLIAMQKQKPHYRDDNAVFHGGDDRDRTDYLLNAIQALSQMSYAPICIIFSFLAGFIHLLNICDVQLPLCGFIPLRVSRDLLNAIQALSQVSYAPICIIFSFLAGFIQLLNFCDIRHSFTLLRQSSTLAAHPTPTNYIPPIPKSQARNHGGSVQLR